MAVAKAVAEPVVLVYQTRVDCTNTPIFYLSHGDKTDDKVATISLPTTY